MIGDLDTHDALCRFLAEHSGCRVLSVDYRLAPEHPFPTPVEDAVAAFAWAHENAAELGADPERMAVGGDSAGGNLSTALCLQNRDAGNPQPAMQLLLYPVTDAVGGQQSRDTFAEGFLLTRKDMEWFENHYIPDGIDDDDPRASMMRAARRLRPAPRLRRHLPASTRCATRARSTRRGCARPACRWCCSATPSLIHGFANLTAICPSARTAMLEVAGALRMGLGLAATAPAAVPA